MPIQEDRHMRQTLIEEIGTAGQQRLKAARVLVIGAGGLGGPALYYLAAAGVGSIHIVDTDVVSITNLNRQILYTEADLGRSKAQAACQRLSQLDHTLQLIPHFLQVTQENIDELLSLVDLVVDCVDNAQTRHIVNAGCVRHRLPLIEGGINRFDGYVFPIIPGKTACYACAHPTVNTNADGPIPVLGATAGVIGSMQAATAVRMLCNLPVSAGIRHLFSLVDLSQHAVPVARDPYCPICSGLKD